MKRRRAETQPDRRMAVEVGTAQWEGTRPEQNDVVSVTSQGDGRGICVMMADGIGTGSSAGAAANAAVQAMLLAYSARKSEENPILRMIQSVGGAHQAVLRVNGRLLDQGQMSTGAAVACVLAREDQFFFCSVGNVRIFLYRNGGLLLLNRDFLLSTSAETESILEGEEPDIDPEWNLRLTAYAGMDGLKELDWPEESLMLMPDDQILMMSSGMYGIFSEKEWEELLDNYLPQSAAEEAIRRVQQRRNESQSNISLAILRFS